MPVEKKTSRWGDEDEEEENETQTDSNGIKERIKFSVNAKGQKVKTTVKIKVKEAKTRVPLRVLERKNLPRFGDAKVGEENVTLPSRDFVSMEHPDDQINEDADDPGLAKTLANFISKQAERGMARDHDLEGLLEEEKGPLDVDVVMKSDNPGKYVPPGAKGGSSTMEREGQENTLRVSNLTKAVTEDDLRELFERFGRIHRISLPRIEKDGVKEPRGFAYIAFVNREDAEKALDKLQGYGYDHLIIKLEWAKPTKDSGGGGGGLSGGYMSGYGKQLVQDTKEKVYYASNLTGNS